MAETVTIARPYAEAVFKLAQETGRFDAWSDTLQLMETVIRDTALAACIGNPNVSADNLQRLIEDVCGDRLDSAGKSFLQALQRNSRLSILPEIRNAFEALRLENEGIIEAQIHSAFPIDDAQVTGLVKKLESKYQRKVRAKVSVDSKLIGGIKIVVGDNVVDATVRGKLDAMSAVLIR